MRVEDVQDLTGVNQEYQVPPDLQSCHTAIADGYIIVGHVPVSEIKRLLDESPNVRGLAVAGMPIGSPGMESDEHASEAYDVVAFDESGVVEVYASYRP